MNRTITKSKVSSDGVLNLSLPLGLDEANREVKVTVDLITDANSMTPEAWQAWVDSMAGSWHVLQRLSKTCCPRKSSAAGGWALAADMVSMAAATLRRGVILKFGLFNDSFCTKSAPRVLQRTLVDRGRIAEGCRTENPQAVIRAKRRQCSR